MSLHASSRYVPMIPAPCAGLGFNFHRTLCSGRMSAFSCCIDGNVLLDLSLGDGERPPTYCVLSKLALCRNSGSTVQTQHLRGSYRNPDCKLKRDFSHQRESQRHSYEQSMFGLPPVHESASPWPLDQSHISSENAVTSPGNSNASSKIST